jgi:hypothetical protein
MPQFNPSVPRLLYQSSIPFIIPSSGSMGNNGALTMTTTVTFTYPKAYVYLPANAIVAGSAAGWYYTVFSSATVGTVFNNIYDPTVGGEPTVPTSPTAFATTGPGAYTQAVEAGRQGPSFTLPASTLSTTGLIRFSLSVRCPNTANVKSVAFRQGTTALTVPALASTAGVVVEGVIQALGATNSQATANITSIGGGTLNQPAFPVAFDFATALGFNVFPLIANAADNMVLAYVRVTLEA